MCLLVHLSYAMYVITCIYCNVIYYTSDDQLQQAANYAVDWCDTNKMLLNASKSNAIFFYAQKKITATQWIKLLLVKIWLWELSAHIEWNCIEELCSLLRSLLLCSNEYRQKPIVLCRCALHRHDAKTAKAYCWLACVDLKQCWG